MRLKLDCTLAEYDGLWAGFHGSRAGQVKVDREALGRLLRDHARVLARLGDGAVDAYPPAVLAKAAS